MFWKGRKESKDFYSFVLFIFMEKLYEFGQGFGRVVGEFRGEPVKYLLKKGGGLLRDYWDLGFVFAGGCVLGDYALSGSVVSESLVTAGFASLFFGPAIDQIMTGRDGGSRFFRNFFGGMGCAVGREVIGLIPESGIDWKLLGVDSLLLLSSVFCDSLYRKANKGWVERMRKALDERLDEGL